MSASIHCACGKPMSPSAMQCASCEKRHLSALVAKAIARPVAQQREELAVALGLPVAALATPPPHESVAQVAFAPLRPRVVAPVLPRCPTCRVPLTQEPLHGRAELLGLCWTCQSNCLRHADAEYTRALVRWVEARVTR